MEVIIHNKDIDSLSSKINLNEWSEFVGNHPNGNIFQTPEMYRVYQETEKYSPFLVIAIDEKNKIKGILLAFIQKEYKGIFGNLTARAIVLGGPIINNNSKDILTLILNAYNNGMQRKAIYSQFRNMWDFFEFKSIFFQYGFKFEEHLNILVNLNKSEEELWKDVNTKRRNEIRRASKEGTTFVIKNSIEDLHECYHILNGVYKRVKLPLPDVKFFENILKINNQNIGLKLFCALNNNKIIGCMLALYFKQTIYDFYAGALPNYYKKYPNDLIPWEVFLWGKKNDFTIFDFGGAGKPNVHYGVRDYKKKFGGKFVNYGRFEKKHKPFLFLIIKQFFLLWKKFQ